VSLPRLAEKVMSTQITNVSDFSNLKMSVR
jgi:hypothetical protein